MDIVLHPRVLFIAARRHEHDHLDIGADLANAQSRLLAARGRQVEREQDHVRLLSPRLLDGFFRVGSFADDTQIRLRRQELRQPLAEQRLTICHDDARRHERAPSSITTEYRAERIPPAIAQTDDPRTRSGYDALLEEP